MTIWLFIACILGSALGTVFVLAVALAVLFWLDEPARKTQAQGQDDMTWLYQLDGRRNP